MKAVLEEYFEKGDHGALTGHRSLCLNTGREGDRHSCMGIAILGI